MNIGVLGTGVVGETIASALTEKGHQVRMGSRSANNEKAQAWVKDAGNGASQGDFNDAAAFGAIIFLCLNGAHALGAVRSVKADSWKNKLVIDLTNPLDFSHGMPPGLLEGVSNFNSLGEEIQKLAGDASVVKALNTITAKLMVNPGLVNGGDHHLFICGNDAEAKNKVKGFLTEQFGWKKESFLDLGALSSARMTEAYVPLWVSMMQALGTPMFSIKLVK